MIVTDIRSVKKTLVSRTSGSAGEQRQADSGERRPGAHLQSRSDPGSERTGTGRQREHDGGHRQ